MFIFIPKCPELISETPKAAIGGLKKVVLKISENSQENTSAEVCFLINLQAYRPVTLLKETPTLVFPCKTSEIFENTYFEEYVNDFL